MPPALPTPSAAGEAGRDQHVLTFAAVNKTFPAMPRPISALTDISITVRAGEVTGLIGPDGAGKTTLMRLAAGLLIPDSGHITVLGMDVVQNQQTVQASIGYMPQRFGLYEDLTVQENLDLYADLQGAPVAERPAHYEELLRMTGLGPFLDRLAGRLSGGMKQKLGLACTLVRPPRLLLLDEPTVGVDPVSRRELWAIVYRLTQEQGMSVLLSTAYLDEAERCHQVLLLNEGRLLGSGPPGSFSRPLSGRTFVLTVPAGERRRVLETVSGQTGITDAIIARQGVRVVTETPEMPPLAQLFPSLPAVGVEAVPPSLEDGFVALLHEDKARPRQTKTLQVASAGGALPPGGGDGPVIAVHDVQRRFGDFYAVKGVSFEVRRGEVFGLLGANGAGKSTTFRMLCGLLPASAGDLRVAGVDLRQASATARARIGYMSQKFSLYGNLSVRQNLDFFSSAYNLAGNHRRQRLDWALETFDLAPLAETISGGLPLGYKQRLALACALMHEPDILFLDEPTSGVDPLARREFWHHINMLAAQQVTVLVTTHFMEEAEYCDRLAIMAEGSLLALGTPEEIKNRARSADRPDPDMEDAFIHLITVREQEVAA